MSLVLCAIIALIAFVQLDFHTAAAQPPPFPVTQGFQIVHNYVASQEATWPSWFPPAAAGQTANRSFGYSVPSQFEACNVAQNCIGHGFPLIVALHGGGGTFHGARNWVIEGNTMNPYRGDNTSPNLQGYETKAAFFLYPGGVPTMGWRDPGDDTVASAPGGGFPLNSPDSYKDVHFITELVHKMLNNPSYYRIIDPNRVYVLGYSNGAHMAQVLACLRARVFRSFGIFNRELNPNLTAKCGVADDPDIVTGMGPANSTVPVPGYPNMWKGPHYVGMGRPVGAITRPMMFFSGSQDSVALQASVESSYDAFRRLMGANAGYSSTNQGDPVNESVVLGGGANTLWEQHTNAAVPGGSTMRRVKIQGGDHSVPTLIAGNGGGPRGSASCITDADCNHSMDYSGMDKLWSFWNQHAGLNLP